MSDSESLACDTMVFLLPRSVDKEEGEIVVQRAGVLSRIWQLWPLRFVIGVFRGAFRMLGFSSKGEEACRPSSATGTTSPRQCLSGRKRLGWVTRVMLFVLPRRLQSALGYPVCTGIGRSLSPEVGVSPTKPCGKGSKRKQDELDDEEEEEGSRQTWVEVLTQGELLEDACSEDDPSYVQPSAEETDSEEYCEHNDTGITQDSAESDNDLSEPEMVIK